MFPVPIDQVAIPVGGKAYLPCDTRYSGQNPGMSTDSSGFFMVMWFKEQKESNAEVEAAASSTAGEPIFT